MSAPAFALPPALEATAPPEARGISRDGVRLMVAHTGSARVRHAAFNQLPDLLDPGDLVVVNVSATLPAAVVGTRGDGTPVRVHFATRAPGLDERWRTVELRSADGGRPARGRSGETIALPGAAGELTLVAPYASGSRLLLARLHGPGTIESLLTDHGEPIRYGYVAHPWPLSAYQNVYATTPGSAEMPSAGRPFTHDLITALAARGIAIAPITLHTGVSSPERHEPPFPEEYAVAPDTARLINATRSARGRVIAVGTTVVRALHTVARADGTIVAGAGWTRTVIAAGDRVAAVDGLITGWHEPQASHLQMLAAIAGESTLRRSYREALDHRYLWHEFGDSHLILP
ncbi:MAG: S-adenosylmethionine:tRNA ribosyltransferase-isomerase [Solirubrobacteraceae bacterium]